MRGETCVSSVSVPVPEESPFFVVFLGKKAFANLCSLFLWRRKKFVTASKNMQDQIQIGIVLNCLWGYMELKWEPRN